MPQENRENQMVWSKPVGSLMDQNGFLMALWNFPVSQTEDSSDALISLWYALDQIDLEKSRSFFSKLSPWFTIVDSFQKWSKVSGFQNFSWVDFVC